MNISEIGDCRNVIGTLGIIKWSGVSIYALGIGLPGTLHPLFPVGSLPMVPELWRRRSVQYLTLALRPSRRVWRKMLTALSIPVRLQSNSGMKTLQPSCYALILFLSLSPPIYFFNYYEV